MNHNEQLKQQLRAIIKQKRLALTAKESHQAAQTIAQHFLNVDLFHKSNSIGCYYAAKGEVNTLPIIHLIWQHQKTCYLPIIDLQQEKKLYFSPYYPETILKANCFGIPEPTSSIKEMGEHLDLILVPLVAVDLKGNRLGMGAGFYDRTFAFKAEKNKYQKPFLLGLAYDFQKVHDLPTQTWDIPLQGVISESGVTLF